MINRRQEYEVYKAVTGLGITEEREHEDDAVSSIDCGRRQAQRRERLRHQAVAAQQNDPGIRADERRAHQRQDDEHMQDVLAQHVVARHDVCDEHTDDHGPDPASNEFTVWWGR